MLVPFLYALREEKVPVGPHELIALADALNKEVHQHTLLGFFITWPKAYWSTQKNTWMLLIVPSLDFFMVLKPNAKNSTQALFDWLKDPLPFLDDETRKQIEKFKS